MTPVATMPSMYVPHGGGPAFFMEGDMGTMFQPMADYLASIRETLPALPTAILVVTGHWEAPVPTFTSAENPNLIYDYGGFPPHTYKLTYPADGEPALANRAAALMEAAGIDSRVDSDHGWDHGVFIPLKVMFPDADIPVVAMSLRAGLDPKEHIAMGRALAPLRDEGVLILGSGMSFHNMRMIATGADESMQFDEWLDQALDGDQSQRAEQLAKWSAAPSGRIAHPREEHLIPLMVASGAGSDQPAHKTWEGAVGDSRVSAWAFS